LREDSEKRMPLLAMMPIGWPYMLAKPAKGVAG